MARKSGGGQAAPAARRSISSTNPVEQLNLLRGFVGDTAGYSETDLVNCLKQSGYNVQRAAELLITGQFQRTTGEKQKNAKSAFFSVVAKSPLKDVKKNGVILKNTLLQPKIHASISKIKPAVSAPKATMHKMKTPAAAAITDVTTTAEKAAPEETNTRLLLCRRWLSDAVITSRKGRVAHKEKLHLEHSLTGHGMVRFRAANADGRLPENLAVLLTPLLRHDGRLIEVQAESMMEDNTLIMGSSLPVQVTVYITSPRTFFDSMLVDPSAMEPSKASQYFASKGTTNKRNGNSKNLSTAEAAFLLLQWAEYGDVPDFKVAPPTETSDANSAEDTKPAAKDSSSSDSEDADLELNEDEFEAASDDGSTAQGKALAGYVEEASDKWSTMLPEAQDPEGFADHVTLRPYQKQALSFMLQRETSGESREQLEDQLKLLRELSAEQQQRQQGSSKVVFPGDSTEEISCECGPVLVSDAAQKKSTTLDGEVNPVNHPLWKRRFLAPSCMSHSISFYVNELMGVATYKPPVPPKPCSGGILADAMGLGKTVMLMALILRSKEARLAAEAANKASRDAAGPTPTLVVAKLSLLPQWEAELQSKTNLTYKIYYGQNGKPPSVKDLQGVDVVVTTYGTVQGELRRKNPVLILIHWLRVILDEAHCIRNQRTLASKVCCNLKAEHRWCVSGTIVQNSLDDVFGIMKFLKHEPWCMPPFWNAAITAPANAKASEGDFDPERREESLQTALDRVRRLLGPLMLRRTKDSVTKDGEPILTLPPVETKVIKVVMSETEREFYNAVLARSLEVFDGFMESGTASRVYFQIFSMLSRLRQACDHIALTVKSKLDDDEWIASSGQDQESEEFSGVVAKAPAKAAAKDTDALGKQFLDGLLKKFCEKQLSPKKDMKRSADETNSSTKRAKDQAYVSRVAHSLTQAVEENSSHIDEECAICLDNPKMEEAVLTPCAHIFCRTCLVDSLRSQASAESKGPSNISSIMGCPDGKCPTCQGKVEAKRIIALSKSRDGDGSTMTSTFLADMKPSSSRTIKHEVRETQEGNPFAVARQILENAVSGTESSKMSAIMQELNEVWKLDAGSKVLIFSHYLGFLDLLGNQLRNNGIPFFRLDGSLTLKERMNVLDQFRSSDQSYVPEDPRVNAADGSAPIKKGTVMLMSMSAGGEGLNIVAASSCFILEPWWNSAKEDQCVHRILRFGQLAPLVRVRKFIVEDSVEERIVELQRKKAYVAGEIYSDVGRTGDLGSSRLSLDDFRLIFRSS